MPSPSTAIDLPPGYELDYREQVDDVTQATARLASAGAGEGLLLWANHQAYARTPGGHPWHAPPGNLHCGLILEPEPGGPDALGLLFVNAVAIGNAIAELVSPMTGLRYRWPGAILLNDLLAGHVHIAYGHRPPGRRLAGSGRQSSLAPDWVVVSLSVNVIEHPANGRWPRYNSLNACGEARVTAAELLSGYTRHFLSWVNRWADHGNVPVINAWRARADGIGEALPGSGSDITWPGKITDFDDQGAVVLSSPAMARRTVSLVEYWGLRAHV